MLPSGRVSLILMHLQDGYVFGQQRSLSCLIAYFDSTWILRRARGPRELKGRFNGASKTLICQASNPLAFASGDCIRLSFGLEMQDENRMYQGCILASLHGWRTHWFERSVKIIR